MQINRLFEIVYILLSKKTVTAKELAEHFEVSIRTIYRDIDTLSTAGIPVYTSKGKGGGISLVDNYVLNKSMFSEREQNEILMSVQSLNAIKVPDIDSILNKLSVIFNKQSMNWIDVDFSRWGSDSSEQEKFKVLKEGILNKTLVTYDYYSSYGEKTKRIIEPLKLIFKGVSWYLYGFCKEKKDFRFFKITRIRNLNGLEETFERNIPSDIKKDDKPSNNRMVKLVLRIDSSMAYRVYDEFDNQCINRNADGSFDVTISFPEDEWVYDYIMSYGSKAEVLEPEHIRKGIKRKFEEGLKKYL